MTTGATREPRAALPKESMLKDEITSALQTAMREREQVAVSSLRLALAAIKDLEISARAEARQLRADEILSLLRKMVQQRRDSASIFAENGRPEMAKQEEAEIVVLSRFLPQELGAEALERVLDELIAENGAESLRDIGRVMAGIKEQYAGRVDMRRASEILRRRLA